MTQGISSLIQPIFNVPESEEVMRITVSLTDGVANLVDQLAAERKVSRSQLFAQLIEEERNRLLEQKLAQAYVALAEGHRQFADMAVGVPQRFGCGTTPFLDPAIGVCFTESGK